MTARRRGAPEHVLTAFSDIVRRTMSSLDLQATLQALPANVAGLVDADVACLYFLEDGADRLQLLAHHGYRALGPEDHELSLGRGVNAAAATSGRLQRVDDYWTIQDVDQAQTRVIRAEPLRSLIVAPLVGRGRTLGTISAGRRTVRPFSDEDVFMLELLGGQAAIAIDNALSYEALSRAREAAETTARRLQLAVDLAMDVAGSLDPEEVVNRSLRHLRGTLEVDWAALLQVEGESGRVIGARGPAPMQIGQSICLDDPLVRQATQQAAPAAASSNTVGGPVASVPLTVRDRLDAVLIAGRSPGESFSEADLMSLIQIGTLAMLAHRNALHYRAEQEATQRAQAAGRRLATGIEVALDLAGRVELEEVVQQLLVRAVEATDAGAGSLSTVQGSQARLIASYNPASAPGAIEPEPVQDSLINGAIQERKPIQERQPAGRGQPELTGLAMPLVLGGEVAGVLAVSRAGPELFAAEEIATLQHIGNVAVLAIRNARLLAEAKDSSLAQQKFMNMAAHELRTPLAVIRGYLSMLEDGVFGAPPESWKESLRIVSGKSHELAHLIDEMLLAARLQAGISPMRQDLVDLRAVVARAAERATPRATMLGAKVDLRLPADPVSILGDDETLGRVLDNLINNSLTYSDRPARVRITVQPGPKPVVEVADRGWGVPPELSEQIFESFFRGDDPSRPYSPGTGLGLAISREIIERHGGRLVLHSSRPGKGSRFRFWLPGAGQPETAGVGALPVLAAES